MSAVTAFDCPHCGKTLRAKPSHAGRSTACPKCGEKVTVPAPGAGPAEEAALEIVTAPAIATGPAAVGRSAAPAGRSRRKKKASLLPLYLGGGVLGLSAIGLGAFALLGGDGGDEPTAEKAKPGVLLAVADQAVTEGQAVEILLVNAGPFAEWTDPAGPRGGSHAVALTEAPQGARLSRDGTGLLWTPGEEAGPGAARVTVALAKRGAVEPTETATFTITVAEDDGPPWIAPLAPVRVAAGESVAVTVSAEDPDRPAKALAYSLDGDAPAGVTLDDAGVLTVAPAADAASVDTTVNVRVTETAADGAAGLSTVAPVRIEIAGSAAPAPRPEPAAEPKAEVAAADPAPTPQPDPTPAPTERAAADPTPAPAEMAAEDPAGAPAGEMRPAMESDLDTGAFAAEAAAYEEQFVKPLVARYGGPDDRRRPLLALNGYGELRKFFADEFARANAAEIDAAFGEKKAEILIWLEETPEVREALFTAFGPGDDPAAGLAVFARLFGELGEDLRKYPDLAIAAAVVWDRPEVGPYDYARLAKLAKAEMPADPALLDAVGNAKYLTGRDAATGGVAGKLPWELLTLVVDHRTPEAERDFALQTYGNVRERFGLCYDQVPYDDEMARTDYRRGALNDKPYTLPSVLEHGGVSGHRADYAARVGKSLGVPAMYVWGEGKYGGGGRAWVMWANVTRATAAALTFTLETHGRDPEAGIYVGELHDPQTGEETTDRDLMRRLHEVATDRDAARHARLLMRAYPIVAAKAGPDGGPLSFDDRLDYLDVVSKIDPWNAPAWRERADLAAGFAGEFDKQQVRRLKKDLTRLFREFAPFPDFTRDVFAGLASYETDEQKRLDLTRDLLGMYAEAGRPDLSFETLPAYVDRLTAADRKDEALQAVVTALTSYADEGGYVPAALDLLDGLAADRPGDLAQFYATFLPLIPPTRGNKPSEYAVAMHKRAIEAANAADRDDLAEAFTARMRAIGEGKLKTDPKAKR